MIAALFATAWLAACAAAGAACFRALIRCAEQRARKERSR